VVSDSFVALRPFFPLTDIFMSLHSDFPHQDTFVARHLAKRWCLLAETRLAYLTELFETGRWRRFHDEVEFLENIQEAKDAVERWRAMAAGETGSSALPHGSVLYQAPRAPVAQTMPGPRPTPDAVTPVPVAQPEANDAPLLIPIEKLIRQAPPRDFAKRTAPFQEATVTPEDLDWETALDPVSISKRYPMLRAAM
jgi:uncharacterized repeat protein (TIGR03809 family)